MSQAVQPIQQAITNQITNATTNQVTNATTDQTTIQSHRKHGQGDGDKSGGAGKVGPAVILNLQNTKANDAAQGDPDGDGH